MELKSGVRVTFIKTLVNVTIKVMQIKVKKLHPDAKLPTYAHPGDAGMDLFTLESFTVPSGKSAKIRTGLAFELPEGHVGLCWDKSGLSINHSIKSLGGVLDEG